MDAETINLVLTALTAAAAGGVTASVKDLAGDATKSTYRAVVSGVVRMLRSAPPAEAGSEGASDVEAEQLVENFQTDPESWRAELKSRLQAVEGPAPLAAALGPDADVLLRQGLVAFLDNQGVQYAPRSVGATQTNYFGTTPTG